MNSIFEPSANQSFPARIDPENYRLFEVIARVLLYDCSHRILHLKVVPIQSHALWHTIARAPR